jgi:hypothetical protein
MKLLCYLCVGVPFTTSELIYTKPAIGYKPNAIFSASIITYDTATRNCELEATFAPLNLGSLNHV